MAEPRLDLDDFEFNFRIHEDKNIATVTHMEVSDEHRGQGHGSFIIETIKRLALKHPKVEELQVSMGGGETAEKFLQSNGFKITNRREYSGTSTEYLEGEYGVDAVYKEEWISEDY